MPMKRSTYSLANAVNYAKLALKAACRDQDAAEAIVTAIFANHASNEDRLSALGAQLRLVVLESESVGVAEGTLEALKAWFKMQSEANTTALYIAADKLFGGKFNPAEYDSVE